MIIHIQLFLGIDVLYIHIFISGVKQEIKRSNIVFFLQFHMNVYPI